MADTTNTTGTGEIAGVNENLGADAVLSGAEGQEVLVGQAGLGEAVELTNESQEVSVDPGDNFILPEGVSQADIQFIQDEGSLVITLPGDVEITFTDFFVISNEQEEGGLPPALTLSDGTVMDPTFVIAQIDNFDPEAVAAAAGGQGGGDGNASFSPYASGDIGPGDDALDLLGNLPGFPFALGDIDEEFADDGNGLFQAVTALSVVDPVGLSGPTPSDPVGNPESPANFVISGSFDGGFEDALPNVTGAKPRAVKPFRCSVV